MKKRNIRVPRDLSVGVKAHYAQERIFNSFLISNMYRKNREHISKASVEERVKRRLTQKGACERMVQRQAKAIYWLRGPSYDLASSSDQQQEIMELKFYQQENAHSPRKYLKLGFDETLRYRLLMKQQQRLKQAILAQIEIAEASVTSQHSSIGDKIQTFSLLKKNRYFVEQEGALDELSKRFLDEWMAVHLKLDPFLERDQGTECKSGLVFSNQTMGREIDLEKEEFDKCFSKHYFVEQGVFDFRSSLRNLHMLSDHFIDVFRQVMSGRPDMHFLTKPSDYRCYMLGQHLLKFELWSIFLP